MENKRLLEILDNILAWGGEHDKEFLSCMLYASEMTKEELEELGIGED